MSELPPDLPPLPRQPPAAPASPPVLPPLPEAERNHQLSTRVEGVGCPSCGGELEIDTGRRVVECRYCGSPLLVRSEIGVRRLAVEPRVPAEEARRIARSWLGRGVSKDRALRREAKVGEAFLSFLPFYRVEADCVGSALGTVLRRRTVGSGKRRRTETYEEDVERTVERSFDHTYPAANVAEWGIRRVDLRGDPLVPFDSRRLERQGMVFPPTGSEATRLESAVAEFKERCDPARGLHSVRFRFLESLRERLSVVYYPIWVVRYRFRKRSYQVLVDAEDGSLAYGKAPGNDFFRALMLVATQAATLFVGTTALQLIGDVRAMLFVGLPLVAVLAWGWKKFRHGGVVIEGSGTQEEPGLAATAARALATGEVPKRLMGGWS